MAVLTLRLVKNSPLTNAEIDNNFSNINIEVGTVGSNVGVLSNLTTTTKTNVVSAVNEVRTSVISSAVVFAIALG